MALNSFIQFTLNALDHGTDEQKLTAARALAYVGSAIDDDTSEITSANCVYTSQETNRSSIIQSTIEVLSSQLLQDNLELTLTCLESLKHYPDTDLSTLIGSYHHSGDIDIKLSVLDAITNNRALCDAIPFLCELVIEEMDYWDGEWNDGDDIRLKAAQSLVKCAHALSREQCSLLSEMLFDDLDPELKRTLLTVLSIGNPTQLELIAEKLTVTEYRSYLNGTHNRAALYKAMKSQDMRSRQIAYRRLSQSNAREYLQEFLSGLSNSDVQIRRISIETLARWQYSIELKHISTTHITATTELDLLSTLLKPEAKMWFIEQWSQDVIDISLTPSIIKLSVSLNDPVDSILDRVYTRFNSLGLSSQIETLEVIFTSIDKPLSLAFIRQQLESTQTDNAVRQALVTHLSQQELAQYQCYFEQLLLQQGYTLDTPTDTSAYDAHKPMQSKNVSNPTSTLAALSIASTDSNKQRKDKKRAKLEAVDNQTYAIANCNNANHLIQLCSEEHLSTMRPQAASALVMALVDNNIPFSEVSNSQLENVIAASLADESFHRINPLLNWLGKEWLDRNWTALINHERLAVQQACVSFIHDEQSLNDCFAHPYIGIQEQAIRRLAHLGYLSDRLILDAIVSCPLLINDQTVLRPQRVYQALMACSVHHPVQALNAFAKYTEARTKRI